VQPVVDLSVSTSRRHRDADHVDVTVGQTVRFSARAQVPPGAGEITSAEWDFEGTGTFPDAARIDRTRRTIRVDATHTFTEPGTYFPVVRVNTQRDGDPTTPFTQIPNLARVRVTVHP